MADMSEQLIYPIGIDDLFICMMREKETGNTGPVYAEKIWRLPVISKLKIKGNGKDNPKYASNKLFARISRESQHELTLDQVSLPMALIDEMKGLEAKRGVAFGKTTPKERPFFALGFIGPYSENQDNGVWYPRCQLSAAVEENYETAKEDLEIKDVSMTITASGLLLNNVLYSDFNSARKSADVTVNDFMKQVIYDESQLEALGKDKAQVNQVKVNEAAVSENG